MVKIVIADTYQRTIAEFNRFCNSLKREDIKKILRYRMPREVILRDGQRICFMAESTYDSWCKGKEYQFYGDKTNTVFRSRIPVGRM